MRLEPACSQESTPDQIPVGNKPTQVQMREQLRQLVADQALHGLGMAESAVSVSLFGFLLYHYFGGGVLLRILFECLDQP